MTTPCPDCSAPLTGSPTCAACGLALTGPDGARLWQVDQRIALLDGELRVLRSERVGLLARLRSGVAAPQPTPPVLPRAPESSPQSVQNTLLGLGALLLAGAGLVFAAVTYNHVGVVGRALVLLLLTATGFLGSRELGRRRLTDSAEAIGAVTLVLAVVDAWAIRRAGLGADLDASSYAAVASGVLAVLAGGWAATAPLRTTQVATVVLAQGPALFVLAHQSPSLAATSLVLGALGAVNILVPFEGRLPELARRTAAVIGGLLLLGALRTGVQAIADHDRAGALGILLLAVVAGALGRAVTERPSRDLLLGAVPLLAALAAWGSTRESLTAAQQPLVAVAVALLALQVAALLPRADRNGPVAGALLVAAAGLTAEGEAIVVALAGPFTWLAHPWTVATSSARQAVSTDQAWDGTVVTLIVLLGAAVCAAAGALLLDRVRHATVPVGVLLVLSAVVLPLGLATGLHVALALQLLVAAVLAASGALAPDRDTGRGLVAAGVATGLLTAVWSLADQGSTLAVLPVVAALAAAVSLRFPGAPTALALALGGGELAAYGAAQGLAVDQVGGLLLVAVATTVALSFGLRGHHRLGAEAGALLLAGTAVGLTVGDPGWLSWSLAGTGLLALAVAVRADRRRVGIAGALLLSASSWVRLADAHVSAPEPYVLPLAAVALAFGWLRRRRHPAMGSFEAYASGLTLALVPSLLKALGEDQPTRGLLVLLAAAAVVLAGVPQRLRAPLVIGGGVVVIDAVQLLAPYADALPRWLVLAVAGGLLVAVGATYEQRRRDVTRIRRGFAAWV